MKTKYHLILATVLLLPAAALQAADLTSGYVIGGPPFNASNLFVDQAAGGGGDTNAVTGDQPWVAVLSDRWLANQSISITGIALPIRTDSAAGTLTFTFYDLGADNAFTGVANEALLGTATVNFSPVNTSAYSVVFDTPVDFTSVGTGIAVRISSSAAARFKISTPGTNFAVRLNAGDGSAIATNPAFKLTLAGINNSAVDTDMDGLPDYAETNTGVFVSNQNTGTDPNNADTDGDLLNDGQEITLGTNPFKQDTDNDGLTDGREANSALANFTNTSPTRRDTDADGLGDQYEVDNGLDALTNADFDNDTFTDADEVLFYSSNPKLAASFPGDGTSPAPGSFTAIQDAGPIANGSSLDLPNTLGSVIINEATNGGNDYDYPNGVTNFAFVYPNLFPAAGSAVSITGFAWTVSSAFNISGDIRLEFYDLGADGALGGLEKETLVGVARGTLLVPAATSVMYWNFTPINFTSQGKGLAIRIISTEALRLKGQDNLGSALWTFATGNGTLGNIRSSRLSIGGTAVAPALPRILSFTRSGTANTLTWDLNGVPSVTVERSTDLGITNPWMKVLTNSTNTIYMENSADPRAFFRLSTP